MGFTTGFTGGVTLTLGIAYVTVLAHERNRQAQALALRSQSRVLQSLIDPTPLPPPPTRAEIAREERSTLVETAKDRWNEEIENAVRWVQRKDWGEVREGMEDAVARLLASGLQKSREGIELSESQVKPEVQEGIDKTKAARQKVLDQVSAGIDKAASTSIAGVEKAGAKVRDGATKIAESMEATTHRTITSSKEQVSHVGEKASEYGSATKAKTDRAATEAKSEAHEIANLTQSNAGTVHAARGAVRGVIQQGIEKGKEVIGKAQEAVGLATESAQPRIQSSDTHSEIQKALDQRYEPAEKRTGLEKTVEQTLEERYKPSGSRDNTVLRGV
ncbi:hypothetical protein B7494_g1466 [Chlorociboria aeruginascens]|nr:hypothetical protein B7494_g1466 [Chlorociboria aeruginascens]